ncbi:hypothetical protein ABZ484_21445 [Streptomyces sp. NPDC006393]|uniref:hypothetical protein n=1 Tax=Streptomyces sp. NPDC006393 TaxID=3156763 RepID=UPI0033F1E32E
MPVPGYRRQLRAVVSGSATPYGYTLTLWTATTVTSATRGEPRAVDAAALLVGAALSFVAVGAIAAGGPRRPIGPRAAGPTPVWAALHLPSAGAGMLLCRLLASFLSRCVLWAAVGAVSTAAYLVGAAAQFWYAERHGAEAPLRPEDARHAS